MEPRPPLHPQPLPGVLEVLHALRMQRVALYRHVPRRPFQRRRPPPPPLTAPSLYTRCLSALVRSSSEREPRVAVAVALSVLPDSVLLDLYDTMYKENKILLIDVLSDLTNFLKILKGNYNLVLILKYFQAVVEQGVNLSERLSLAYLCECVTYSELDELSNQVDKLIIDGIRLGGFLNDAGWYFHAEVVLFACQNLCKICKQDTHYVRLTLECCHRLLHAQSSYRMFKEASETFKFSLNLILSTLETSDLESLGLMNLNDKVDGLDKIKIDDITSQSYETYGCSSDSSNIEIDLNNLILRLFKEFAVFYFLRSDYNDTFQWSMRALKLLKQDTPVRIVIDVLRICGKACVIMRKFPWGELLIQQAVARARACYGNVHPKYAFTLLDYGFYFLNVDSILNSVTVYEEALGIFDQVYSGNNLHLAVAHEDLSYALYVHEYSSGRFFKAREHVDCAIRIMESLLPEDHLMLATTKRVKALILEEIALDNPPEDNNDLLLESEALHKSALSLTLNAFGEMNVQTAKHYGNLGRLYQSMKRFEEAESMQLRAIDIKKKILGDDDYEVGLSLGHLASLYNYHMKQYLAAENLYYRSISISLKSFGEEYSGLEYDYIGLINVNNELNRIDKVDIYNQLLNRWRQARDLAADRHLDFGQETEISLNKVLYKIFNNEDISYTNSPVSEEAFDVN